MITEETAAREGKSLEQRGERRRRSEWRRSDKPLLPVRCYHQF